MADFAESGVSVADYNSYSERAFNEFISLNGYAERSAANNDWGRNTGAANKSGCFMFQISLALARELNINVTPTAIGGFFYIIASSTPFIWYGCFRSIYGNTAFERLNISEPVELGGKLYYYSQSHIELEGGWSTLNSTGNFAIASTVYNTTTDLVTALTSAGIRPVGTTYSITYHYTNSAVSGPSEAAVGDTVTVSAVPHVGYGITDASTQILVANNDVAVPYTWDATNNRIMFTMPDPS